MTDFAALSITALLSRMHGLLVYRLLWLRNMVRSLIGCTCDTLKPERHCQVINFAAIAFGSITIISLPFIFESIILYSISFQSSALKVSSQSPVNFCFSIRNKQKLIPTAQFFFTFCYGINNTQRIRNSGIYYKMTIFQGSFVTCLREFQEKNSGSRIQSVEQHNKLKDK